MNSKEKQNYPYEFGLVQLNDIAKMRGINDDSNKIIIHYINGKEYKRYNYSKELVEALKKTHQMPIIEDEENEDEQFEFDTVTEFGTTKMVKRK